MTSKIKILHVCETIKGGTATYLSTFDAVCGKCFDSQFVVPADHMDQLPESCVVIPFERRKRGLKSVLELARVARCAARDFRPHILIFHSTFSLGAMALMRLANVKGQYVYIPHGWARLRYTENALKSKIVGMIEGTLCGNADLILNISKYDKGLAVSNRYFGRHVVVENALQDLPRPLGPSPFENFPGRIDLLFVGRFDRQKGLDILLAAYERAARRNPALHLHIVGASVQENGTAPLKPIPQVTFHGWTPPSVISHFYANADMTVMSSRWEGLPMVLIESLRAGTPVMLADTTGQGELLGDSGAGIAVPLSVSAFEEALAGLEAKQVLAMRSDARLLYETRYGPDRFRTETCNMLEGLLVHG